MSTSVCVAVQATLAWEEKGGHPRAQRGPVAGAATKFSLAPSIGVFGFVPVWARSIFSSSRVVVRAWCPVLWSSAELPWWRCYASARGVRGVQGGVLARGAALWLWLLLRRCSSKSRGRFGARVLLHVPSHRENGFWASQWRQLQERAVCREPRAARPPQYFELEN